MQSGEIKMNVGYFPGCSLHATAREYAESLSAIAGALDLQFDEVKDWACCGATAAHSTNHLLSVALPARTLMLAEKQNLDRVFAPCAACYNRLASAQQAMAKNKKIAAQVQTVLGETFNNSVTVVSIAQLLGGMTDQIAAQIKDKGKKPLQNLKVACYYGCLLVRPPEICQFDDPESPSSMENIAVAAGATPVKWDMALECCGGGFSLSRTASVVRLSRSILRSARKAGAQAVIVACPMCHSNLDFRQKAINQRDNDADPMPILFMSQLVGLGLGLDPVRLGMERHFISPKPVLNFIGTVKVQEDREHA
jgi:heterodisulfide reductase subunit B